MGTNNFDGHEVSRNGAFKILGKDAANVTRTGKPIDDLDRSDLVAMNYMNFTKVGPDDETISGCDDTKCEDHNPQKQYKVSFHQNTTIQ